MKLYLTISAGQGGLETTPIVASSDPNVIAAAVRELMNRLQGPTDGARSVLQLADRQSPVERER